MADKKATLHIEGKAPIELPIMDGSLGPQVIDVRTLGSNGYFTFDRVFLPLHPVNLKLLISMALRAFCCTALPIDQLANNADYLEVCYILLYGEAPNRKQYEEFKKSLLVTLWFMNRSRAFSTVSAVMLTRWL